MELHAIPRIEDIEPGQWNRLAGAGNPFLRHEFLAALERHGAVSPRVGWAPHHLALYHDGALVAAAPAYLKSHSWGEFVFDFAWADAYERHGLDYYPKLVVAVPYSPVNGPRMLLAPEGDASRLRAALADGARAMTNQLELSSAHWLFPERPDHAALLRAGYQHRVGCQYHWYNAGYADFDEFLAGLTSKKRKNIRRERRLVREAGIELRIVHGHEADDALWAQLHGFYAKTFREHGNLPLISRACFADIGAALRDRVVLVVAERGGEPVAGAICLRDDHTLYGRYWGCREEIDGLHFEACYYQGIDYCIRHGLQRFEPGAQGEHKVARGFLPTLTHSAHYLADSRFRDAVGDFLARERQAVEAYAETLTMEGPYRVDMLERLRDEL
ncbi:GNAT family N-acetyltransferase [Spiribacter halobius]|uniref:GNAT family N-acetyltransferase n=1 Tax=Sediminicurvatus halobius TaxID=2182432 RepID=A0A2U2N016_9GAMM|nr:GNAT family N-acetyltransferase [Spiribacter halobius]PWG62408.1 GNAT family N-acetyltransferase [Spiribacter halobius]UEX79508.1 GNAT family N-acetyltransferase [Spiribacter halobius]